jgi:hypothetical protein
MRTPDNTEPGRFELTEGDLGGVSRWHPDTLGEVREKLHLGEYLGVFSATGYIKKDPETDEVYLAELPEEGGISLKMEDFFEPSWEGEKVEVEITVRVREIEDDNQRDKETISSSSEDFEEGLVAPEDWRLHTEG